MYKRQALYRGVPDRVLGLPLSTMLSKDSTSLGDLPPYYREMVTATITVRDLATAESTLEELRLKAEQCIAQREARARATAAPTPQPTQTPAPLWPEPTPGATATPASLSRRLANSMLPSLRKASGIGAQPNMLACGTGISHPARPKLSTSTSRRRL